ncbi:MAG: large repetitive protein, partial [Actinomycetota bacterium]|nr:large repetitive protein [Actinomycetota bacterium]
VTNTSSQKPVEVAGYTNTTASPQTVRIIVAKYSGSSARLKFIIVGSDGITGVEYNTSVGGDIVGPTVFGHSGTSTVAGVAAIPYDNSDTSEDYSSRGPMTLYFQPTPSQAALGAPQVLQQPKFAATDNVQTSFFAQQVSGVWRFAGTSAAAPHAAAIGALVRQKSPGLSPSAIFSTLSSTARPVATNGTADVVGAGYLDAEAALADVISLPGAPNVPTTTNGEEHVTVHWTAPLSGPGFPVTDYVVTEYLGGVEQDSVTADASTTSQLFSGLTNGTTYTFTVTAINANGNGPESAPASVTIGVPNPPTGITAVSGANQATVSWSAPPADDLTITGYTVASQISGVTQATQTFNSTATTQTITGLTNGTPYTFKVASITASATGPFSATSNAVTPSDVPSAPAGVTAYPDDNDSALVAWTAPANNGAPITSYIIIPYLNETTAQPSTTTSGAGTWRVTSLTPGESYSFTVKAVNVRGSSAESAPTSTVRPGTPSAPNPPSAQSGDDSATVTWPAASDNNGSPVTGYTVYAYVGAAQVASDAYASTATTQVFSGLTNGTSYRFAVAASNARGLGPASTLGNATMIGLPTAPTAPSAVPGNARATVRWTAAETYGAAITSYEVTPFLNGAVEKPSTTFNSAATTQVILGLANNAMYTFTVHAYTSRGPGPRSVATAPIRVGAPLAPTAVKAVTGAATSATGPLTVTYAAAANNGATITKYTATCTAAGGVTKSGIRNAATAGPIVVTGLTTKKAYTCTVTAENARGAGPASTPSLPAIIGSPAPPTSVVAKSGSTTAATGPLTVTYALGGNNGSAITSQTATCVSSDGGVTKTATRSGAAVAPFTFAAATTGKTYTCSVKATNARGAGLESPLSLPVIVGSPAAPTGVSAVKVASGQLRVMFTAGASNGSATTSYTATCTSTDGGALGSKTGGASPLTVTSLSAGKSYTCKVKGTNARGAGLSSAASAAVTA